MKLFVDDIRSPWPGWECARTITEAIRILELLPVEEISLDHDICCFCPCELTGGHEHSSEETYEAVARYLAAMMAPPEKIWFHTANPVGGKRMADLLSLNYDEHRIDYATFGKETL